MAHAASDASPAHRGKPPAIPSGLTPATERDLIELLSKASQELRAERRTVTQLLHENDELKAQLGAGGGKHGGGGTSRTSTISELQRQIASLTDIVKRQDSQLEHVKEQLRAAELRAHPKDPNIAKGQIHAASYRAPSPKQQAPSPRPKSYAEQQAARSKSPQRRGDAPAAAAAQPVDVRRASPSKTQGRAIGVTSSSTHQRSSSAPNRSSNAVQSRVVSPPRGTADAVPAMSHHFDAMRSVALAHRNTLDSSPAHQRSTTAAVPSGALSASRHTDPESRAALAAAANANFQDVMMSRLRRAIAPPPTVAQLGEVVDAMVVQLVESLARHNATIELRKVAPCQYQCGRRKLHLAVDSGRLVVKAGGGHVDLMEHIERNRLCARKK